MATDNPLSAVPVTRRTAVFATIALIGFGYSLFIVVVMHFLRPDYDPLRNTISEYVIGPYGILMTSSSLGAVLGIMALVIGLYQGLSQPARSWVGLILLGLWAVADFVGRIFPPDLQGAPATPSGIVHGNAALFRPPLFGFWNNRAVAPLQAR